MADDHDPSLSGNVVRLFPLPGVVLFPHAVMPLHIFEPRYRQMTADALETDKLVAIVCLREPIDRASPGEPSLEEIACVGKILQHERLPDGRYNFLLLGLKRVRLIREVPSEKLYRLAEVGFLDDLEPADPADPRAGRLGRLFLDVAERQGALGPELRQLIRSDLPAAVLTDLVAHALALPASVKQALLAECRVDRRLDQLIGVLHDLGSGRAGVDLPKHRYPPPINLN